MLFDAFIWYRTFDEKRFDEEATKWHLIREIEAQRGRERLLSSWRTSFDKKRVSGKQSTMIDIDNRTELRLLCKGQIN